MAAAGGKVASDGLMRPSSPTRSIRRGDSAEVQQANESMLNWTRSRSRSHEHDATEKSQLSDKSVDASSSPASTDDDTIWVEFEDGEDFRRFGDHGNPFRSARSFVPGDPAADRAHRWSQGRKWAITFLLCYFTFAVAFSGSSFPIGTASMMADLGCTYTIAMLAISSAFAASLGVVPLSLCSVPTGLWCAFRHLNARERG